MNVQWPALMSGTEVMPATVGNLLTRSDVQAHERLHADGRALWQPGLCRTYCVYVDEYPSRSCDATVTAQRLSGGMSVDASGLPQRAAIPSACSSLHALRAAPPAAEETHADTYYAVHTP